MSPIKIIFFGDVFGRLGRQGVKKILPKLKKEYQPHFIIANAENLAHGRGVTKSTIEELTEAGVDFLTSGNHVWDKKDANDILAKKDAPLIRPANYPAGSIGQGEKIVKVGLNSLLVINLMGRVFAKEEYACPFRTASDLLEKYKQYNLAGIIIDIHAEATSEKVALGYYLNGQVSAVLGTHTHVQTADEKILSKGTAYISDVGMTGPADSVIGLEKEGIINNFLNQVTKAANTVEEGYCQINAVYLEIDPKTRQALKLTRINQDIKI